MRYLLVTDLDNTLVGDPQATWKLNRWIAARRDRLYLVYATGRSYASARSLKLEASLLEPDYWVTGTGSEIYYQNRLDTTWADHQSYEWDWEAVWRIALDIPGIAPQAAESQNPWKAAFFIVGATPQQTVAQLREALVQAGLRTQIIVSHGEYVDVLPKESGKGHATAYLREQLQVVPQQTIACGDSGNDITLFEQPTLGVIVGNALPELLTWHEQWGHEQIYLAQSGYANGILEGLAHFGLLHET